MAAASNIIFSFNFSIAEGSVGNIVSFTIEIFSWTSNFLIPHSFDLPLERTSTTDGKTIFCKSTMASLFLPLPEATGYPKPFPHLWNWKFHFQPTTKASWNLSALIIPWCSHKKKGPTPYYAVAKDGAWVSWLLLIVKFLFCKFKHVQALAYILANILHKDCLCILVLKTGSELYWRDHGDNSIPITVFTYRQLQGLVAHNENNQIRFDVLMVGPCTDEGLRVPIYTTLLAHVPYLDFKLDEYMVKQNGNRLKYIWKICLALDFPCIRSMLLLLR